MASLFHLCLFGILTFSSFDLGLSISKNDFLITSERVGNLYEDMLYIDVKKLYTVHKQNEEEDAECSDRYCEPLYAISDYNVALCVYCEVDMGSSVISNIAIYDPQFKTEAEIGVNSTLDDLLKVYPNAIPHFNQISHRATLKLKTLPLIQMQTILVSTLLITIHIVIAMMLLPSVGSIQCEYKNQSYSS